MASCGNVIFLCGKVIDMQLGEIAEALNEFVMPDDATAQEAFAFGWRLSLVTLAAREAYLTQSGVEIPFVATDADFIRAILNRLGVKHSMTYLHNDQSESIMCLRVFQEQGDR